MFTGRYDYAIDEKSRVSIPSKFREVLSANYDLRLVLTNLDGCIAAYPVKEWGRIEEKMASFGPMKKEQRALLRYIHGSASECPLDKLGRVLLPQPVKNEAGIKKNVVIIGMGPKVEIWAQEKYDELVKKVLSDPDQVADIVSELGL
jgi:MraZ protein